MCRRTQLLGVGLMAFGLGLLASSLFESALWCGFVGVSLMAVGVIVTQKR